MRVKFFAGLSIGLLLFGFVGMANAIRVDFSYSGWNSPSVVSTGFFSGEDNDADGFLSLAELTGFSEFTTTLADVTFFSSYELGSLIWLTDDYTTTSWSNSLQQFITNVYPVYYATTPTGRMLNSDWKNVWITADDSIVAPSPSAVPEPSTVILLGSGLAGLAWYSRKRKKA